ncbi:hypothetical protein CPB86DRAFT_779994 [Serendipita vermifera]|nr:hypothetical protein CPB86DRAFT_779994 [Serendipita vermifera]
MSRQVFLWDSVRSRYAASSNAYGLDARSKLQMVCAMLISRGLMGFDACVIVHSDPVSTFVERPSNL